MENVKLACGVQGEGVMFYVKIALNDSVSHLQEAIAEKLPVYLLEQTKACELRLRLARKNDAWMQGEEAIKRIVLDGELTDGFEEMLASSLLSRYLKDTDLTGRAETLHVVDQLPPTEQPPRKRKREESLADMWPICAWNLSDLPSLDHIATLLRKPLPFRLELHNDEAAQGLFEQDAPLVGCPTLETMMNYFIQSSPAPPRRFTTSARLLHDILLFVTTSMLKAKGRAIQTQHKRVEQASRLLGTWPPDHVLQNNGIVLMRGEDCAKGKEIFKGLDVLADKMGGWNPILYGKLPYIIGFAISGYDIHFVLIEKMRHSTGTTSILELNMLEEPVDALKVFFNLALLLDEMIEFTCGSYRSAIKPFLPDISDKRTIVMTDHSVLRAIKRSRPLCGAEAAEPAIIERLHDVYTALQGLKAKGSDKTHLQTVTRLACGIELAVELTPVGYVRHPTIDEVSQWLQHMLTALKYWHGCGYCHGDVRDSNMIVVPNSEEGSSFWVLIDMDKSRKPDTTVINWNHPCYGSRLRYEHDLFQLGRLMDAFQFKLPSELVAIQQLLLGVIDAPYFTAEIALARLGDL